MIIFTVRYQITQNIQYFDDAEFNIHMYKQNKKGTKNSQQGQRVQRCHQHHEHQQGQQDQHDLSHQRHHENPNKRTRGK